MYGRDYNRADFDSQLRCYLKPNQDQFTTSGRQNNLFVSLICDLSCSVFLFAGVLFYRFGFLQRQYKISSPQGCCGEFLQW